MSVLNRKDIETLLPHRFENLLIDSVDSETGVFGLSLVDGDATGRDVVLKTTADGAGRMINPFLMEVGALAAISFVGALEPGKIAVFAAITKFEIVGKLDASSIRGLTQSAGSRGDFYSYGVRFDSDSGHASGTVMAFNANASELGSGEDKKTLDLPAFNCDIDFESPSFKAESMCVLDQVSYFDPETYSSVGRYVYPTDHLLCRGHFPGNPIMMGVMQWMMVSDLGLFLKDKVGDGASLLRCNAEIVKADGVVACEIKGAVLDLGDGAEILATKKVVFRDIVRPGETLFCFVHDVSLE